VCLKIRTKDFSTLSASSGRQAVGARQHLLSITSRERAAAPYPRPLVTIWPPAGAAFAGGGTDAGRGAGCDPDTRDDDSALAGQWTAEGYDPDEDPAVDSPYTGTVHLTAQGNSLLYEGDMRGETYSGIGIWHPVTDTLALYKACLARQTDAPSAFSSPHMGNVGWSLARLPRGRERSRRITRRSR
jgi:hypothetical protein